MASLMENLMDVLDKENSEYEILLEISKRKTPVIVQGDLEQLQKITDEEQDVLDRLGRLEAKRREVTDDVANVLNKDVDKLKLTDLIEMFKSRPAEQKKLAEIHDKLTVTLKQMSDVNEQNRQLIQSSLEMVEFDINLLHSIKTAPETANYNRGAYSSGDMMGVSKGRFDAKQ